MTIIVGVDEAGRGPLAGPVVAAAVILDGADVPGIDDSKRLSPDRRQTLATAIRARCRVGVGVASVAEIDARNILNATMLAMARAVDALAPGLPDELLVRVDGNRLPDWRWHAEALVGGDGSDPSIGAASIIAKTWRDALMVALDATHPGYGFARHKGYGTAEHLAALHRLGPCAAHRRSFAPVRAAAQRFSPGLSLSSHTTTG